MTTTLLDTRGLLLRSHHASSEKNATSENGDAITAWRDGLAIFVENILVPLLDKHSGVPAQDVIAVFDGGNDYRLSLFPDYKKKRRTTEQDKLVKHEIRELMEKATRLLNYLGVKSVYVPGEEADDMIALLCQRLEGRKTIQTVDQDLLQLVDENVSVWLRGRNDELHSAQISSGFKSQSCALVRIHKALCGDSSDGYLGIPRFGQKAFEGLVAAFGEDGMLEIEQALLTNDFKTIEAAYQAQPHPGLKMLLEYWSDARMGLKLSSLHPEACYGAREGKPKKPIWSARIPNRGKAMEVLDELGLAHRVGQFEHLFPSERLIQADQHKALVAAMSEVLVSPVVSWDYESTDVLKHPAFKQAKKKSGGKYVDVLSQKVAGVSINYGQYMEKTVYVPFDHKETGNFDPSWLSWILTCLDERPGGTVVQNANFELTLSKTNVDHMPKAPYDTAIMASYVDENLENHLKGMSLDWLRYTQTSYEEVTQGRDMCDLTGHEVLSYGCDDSLVTSHLFQLFRTIMQCEGSWGFYRDNEVEPAVNDVRDFIDGQEIDYELLRTFEGESKVAIATATDTLHRLVSERTQNRTQDEVLHSAILLLEEWWVTERLKAKGDPDKETELRNKLWEKAWNSCFYQPPTVHKQEVKFAPTLSGLNQVLVCIDAAAPRLMKASGPGVEDFDCNLSDYMEKHTLDAVQEEHLSEFQRLLYKARKKLGPTARSGPEYDALEAFCLEVLGNAEGGKTFSTGDELNIGSTPQMQALLYGKLGLPVRKRSKVDRGSTRDKHKLPGSPATGLKAIAAAFVYDLQDETDWRREALLAYRTVALESQNQSLYYHSYPLWQHPFDGRIHPQLRNCGTSTRRPAGNDPNVLQVSKKEDAKIRKVFPAGDYGDGERVVVSADFANQELVITACEAKDPVMLDAFMSTPRKDLHSLTSTGYAHILLPRLGIDWDGHQMNYDEFFAARKGKLTPELAKATNDIRNKWSKAVNFLIAYLGGYTTLAGNLLIPNDLAKTLMASTFALYPRLQAWQEETIEFARIHGYSQTAYGNRRHATPDLYSSDDYLRKRQERQLVNATVQSTAADILKEVRQEIARRKMRERYRMRATKPVYDEMTASIPFECALEYSQELVEVMSITPPGYPVGMAVELSIGRTWGDQVEVDGTSAEAVQKVLDEVLPL